MALSKVNMQQKNSRGTMYLIASGGRGGNKEAIFYTRVLVQKWT